MLDSNPYRHIYGRIASRVSDDLRINLTAEDVQKLLDTGKGTGNAQADRMIKFEAAEYGIV